MFRKCRLIWALHNSYETSHKPYESRMSKKRTFQTGFSKKSKKMRILGLQNRTDYAATQYNRFVPRFFSAAKKDNLEELKNGHL